MADVWECIDILMQQADKELERALTLRADAYDRAKSNAAYLRITAKWAKEQLERL